MKSHNFIRKFEPVFDRVRETWLPPNWYNTPKWMERNGVTVSCRYIKGENNFWSTKKTSRSKKLWAIRRLKIRKLGQKDFFSVLLKEMA